MSGIRACHCLLAARDGEHAAGNACVARYLPRGALLVGPDRPLQMEDLNLVGASRVTYRLSVHRAREWRSDRRVHDHVADLPCATKPWHFFTDCQMGSGMDLSCFVRFI